MASSIRVARAERRLHHPTEPGVLEDLAATHEHAGPRRPEAAPREEIVFAEAGARSAPSRDAVRGRVERDERRVQRADGRSHDEVGPDTVLEESLEGADLKSPERPTAGEHERDTCPSSRRERLSHWAGRGPLGPVHT